ncbi:MAG: CDP-archaeol synthase [Pseudomonadota bacterium]|nr:CDP-archaeol synthase [Pseudomonadota bacterium]
MSDFLKRFLSSILILVLVVCVLSVKVEFFNIIIGAVVFLLSREWFGLIIKKEESNYHLYVSLFAAATTIFYGFFIYCDYDWIIYLSLFFWLFAFASMCFYVYEPKPDVSWGFTNHIIQGVFVIVPTGVALTILRGFGVEFLIQLFVWVWSTDVGAYIFGKQFGKNKFIPEISPNKTVEGFFGGILTVVLATIVMYYSMELDSYSLLEYIIVGIIISLFAILGDAYESMVKRRLGAKDSGSIIPGHGGVLDRLDSLTTAAPVLAILIFFMPS